jgi:ribosomal protein L36
MQQFPTCAGSQSVAVLVRRLGDIYIIGGTIQPQSNFNDAPFSETVQITLPNVTDSSSPGTAVRFSVRRQGSVFLLNLTKATKKPTIRASIAQAYHP